MMNSNYIKGLFEKEAILINDADVIPEYVVKDLFGEDAIDFAKRMVPGGYNGYGIGYFTIYYLTLRAFKVAATYKNIEDIYKKFPRRTGIPTEGIDN